MSTPRLPHVGLSTSVPGESLYGDDSTIGARGQAERAKLYATLADLAGAELADEVYGESRPPIRVIATVGRPIEDRPS